MSEIQTVYLASWLKSLQTSGFIDVTYQELWVLKESSFNICHSLFEFSGGEYLEERMA